MVLRIFSGLFLLVATIALIADVTRAQLGTPGAPFTPLITQLAESAPNTLAAIQRKTSVVHPLVWDPIVRSLLLLPSWITFGVIGLAFGWFGRRRYGVNVYTN